MLELNDKLLEELGLGSLPKDQKKAFLQYVNTELISRVGRKLTEGMSKEKIEEFARFVDRDETEITEWFSQNLPDYESQADFQKMQQTMPQADRLVLLAEYGSMKWLQKNRPNYPSIVLATFDDLKNEIKANKDKILG
jgi:hypothetical protein